MGVIRVIEDARKEQALDLREKLRSARRDLVQQAAPLAQRKQAIDSEYRTLQSAADNGIVSISTVTEV